MAVMGLCRGGVCATGVCQDGLVDAGEECDDDNTTPGDGCEDDCTFTCELDEDCQDGNACNGAEVCDVTAHTCSSGTAPTCDDGDACTTDSCEMASGCVNASVLVDGDGDGHAAPTATCGGDDCNDAAATVFPGAVEGCGTTMDLNCDGMTSSTPTWYADCDRDGYAASGASTAVACTAPTSIPVGCTSVGWTSRAPTSGAIDCQATNSSARPGQTAWFSSAISGTNYDYNCSGSSTTEFGRRDVRTFVECALSREVCTGTTYWDETTLPACGSTATQSYCRIVSILGVDYCSRSTRETIVRCH
jgi:cysteine-rich repeat protein